VADYLFILNPFFFITSAYPQGYPANFTDGGPPKKMSESFAPWFFPFTKRTKKLTIPFCLLPSAFCLLPSALYSLFIVCPFSLRTPRTSARVLADPHDRIDGVPSWSDPISCVWTIRGWVLTLAGAPVNCWGKFRLSFGEVVVMERNFARQLSSPVWRQGKLRQPLR
jgi:hypothetical protein